MTHNLAAKHPITRTLPDPEALFELLQDSEYGLLTSLGPFYSSALYGRDAAINARLTLEIAPDAATSTILALCRWQDLREGPGQGRILRATHDLRRSNGSFIDKMLFRAWKFAWNEFVDYDCADSTPLFLILVAQYRQRYRDDILSEEVNNHYGKRVTVGDCVQAALDWLRRHIAEDGRVEISRDDALGLFPVWKDSPTAWVHPDGSLVNATRPVVYIDVLSLFAEALEAWASQYPENLAQAQLIRNWTLNNLWMEDLQYFAMGIDRADSHSSDRLIATLASNAGWVLDTGMFDHLPEPIRERYVTGVVRMLFSGEFLTPAGVRCRAIRHAAAIPFADMHGSLASWPIDTFMLARGLHRQGFPKLAEELERRIRRSLLIAGRHYEYFVVSPDGKPVYMPDQSLLSHSPRIGVQLVPEPDLAWPIVVDLVLRQQKPTDTDQSEWQRRLEEELLTEIDSTHLPTDQEIAAVRNTPPPYRLDRGRGWRATAKKLSREMLRLYFR